MDQSEISDITEIEQLLARYAVGMTRDDIEAVMDVFTPDGAYSAFGATYTLKDFPALVAAAPKGLFLTGTPSSNWTATTAPGTSHCALSIRPTTTCGSVGTPTTTAAPPMDGDCTGGP